MKIIWHNNQYDAESRSCSESLDESVEPIQKKQLSGIDLMWRSFIFIFLSFCYFIYIPTGILIFIISDLVIKDWGIGVSSFINGYFFYFVYRRLKKKQDFPIIVAIFEAAIVNAIISCISLQILVWLSLSYTASVAVLAQYWKWIIWGIIILVGIVLFLYQKEKCQTEQIPISKKNLFCFCTWILICVIYPMIVFEDNNIGIGTKIKFDDSWSSPFVISQTHDRYSITRFGSPLEVSLSGKQALIPAGTSILFYNSNTKKWSRHDISTKYPIIKIIPDISTNKLLLLSPLPTNKFGFASIPFEFAELYPEDKITLCGSKFITYSIMGDNVFSKTPNKIIPKWGEQYIERDNFGMVHVPFFVLSEYSESFLGDVIVDFANENVTYKMLKNSSSGIRKTDLAFCNNSKMILWQNYNNEIISGILSDKLNNFTKEDRIVNSVADGLMRFYSVISNENQIHLTWLDNRNAKRIYYFIYGALIDDHKLWYKSSHSSPEKWNDECLISDGIKFSYSPHIASQGKFVIIVWSGREKYSDAHTMYSPSDIFYSVSYDKGKNWSKPYKITDCEKTQETAGTPRVFIIDDTIHVVYVRGREEDVEKVTLRQYKRMSWDVVHTYKKMTTIISK
jgi:membrane protein